MLQVQTSPLERLGISQEMVRRFCARNGVGIKDLSKLIQTVSRHASSPFHTDRNQTPGAEQIFKDIQQAASEMDSEDKLDAVVNSYLAGPATQIDQLRAGFEAKLALLEEHSQSIAIALISSIIESASGSKIFTQKTFKTRRFCTSEVGYENLRTQILREDAIDFKSIFAPHDHSRLIEYSVDENGNVTRYKLKSTLPETKHDIASTNTDYELILDSTKNIIRDLSQYDKHLKHGHYRRVENGKVLNGLKIIGILYFKSRHREETTNLYLGEALSLSYDSGSMSIKADGTLNGQSISKSRLLEYITEALVNGLTLSQFLPLLNSYTTDPDDGILLGYRVQENEPRFLLLGDFWKLHKSTPGLYGEK